MRDSVDRGFYGQVDYFRFAHSRTICAPCEQELLEIFDPVDRLTRIAEKLTMLNIEIELPTEGFRLPFEVRAIFPYGTTEVMPTAAALGKAQAMGLDLILIAPTAIPPVAKVMNYEQWLHESQGTPPIRRARRQK